ncbi:hypothetical protein Bca4012_020041 [Brassica carinata]|uniref:Uncharacterized protein n=1 Tax=Brassica carinata TaxID=52824 RepID=A0A8X8BD63_BRACI|nr:hypothetical protein Bca52824_001547 [Brassica carinata]
MNVQTRVAMETSTSSGLAPLQLEARSAFQKSRAMSGRWCWSDGSTERTATTIHDDDDAIIKVVVSEVPEIILTCISRDEAALAVAQEAFKALYENASSSLTSVPT